MTYNIILLKFLDNLLDLLILLYNAFREINFYLPENILAKWCVF